MDENQTCPSCGSKRVTIFADFAEGTFYCKCRQCGNQSKQAKTIKEAEADFYGQSTAEGGDKLVHDLVPHVKGRVNPVDGYDDLEDVELCTKCGKEFKTFEEGRNDECRPG